MKKILVPVILTLATACAPSAPKPPVPPQFPAERYVQATIRGEGVEAPSGVEVFTAPEIDGYPKVACELVKVEATNETRAKCKLPSDWPGAPHGAHLFVTAPEYDAIDYRFEWDGVGDLPDQHLVPTFKPLPRLQIAGKFFRLETGERFTAIEATDFNLLGRYLNGEDIRPVLAQRRDLGFNLLRVFTAINVGGIGRLVPSEHPDYYTRIPTFLQELSRYGLRAELVAFTGPYESLFGSDDAKVAHWERLISAVHGSNNVLLELVNEYDHPANKDIPISRLRRPDGVLTSHGSGMADSSPLLPVWDYGTYHPGFGEEWPRKAVHNGMEDVADKYGVPVLLNETTRVPDNDQSLIHMFDVGRGCALLEAGCAFHSVTGKVSGLWQGHELAMATEWARGARSMDLRCQSGPYVRRDDLLTPERSRVYERPVSGADCIAIVRK